MYCIVGRYGNENDYKLLKEHYYNLTNATEKVDLLQSLGFVKNKKLINELLNWLLNSNDVKPQDKIYTLSIVGRTIEGRDITFNFLKKTINKWLNMYGGGFIIRSLISIPNNYVSFEKANEIEKWYNTINAPSAKKSMKQAVENIRKYARWQQNDLKIIEQWCKQNQPKDIN